MPIFFIPVCLHSGHHLLVLFNFGRELRKNPGDGNTYGGVLIALYQQAVRICWTLRLGSGQVCKQEIFHATQYLK
jgi:hypothetical protein